MIKDNKDVKKTVTNATHLATHVSERSFDALDKGTKKLSEWRSEQETVLEEDDFSTGLSTATETPTTESINPDDTESASQSNTFVSQLKTNLKENTTTATNESLDDEVEDLESTTDEFEDMESATVEPSKLKTCAKKTLSSLNKKTFGFTDKQGKLSKGVTILSKSGKASSKGGRSLLKTSKTLERAVDGEDGAGTKFVQKSVSKTANKKFGLPLLKKLMNFATKLLMKAGRVIISMMGGVPMVAPLLIFLIIVLSIGMIFGVSGSEGVVGKYETYMQEVQEKYDSDVDSFKRENPDGVVIGVRGDYGQISWQAPLSIMQGLGEKLDYDLTEILLLNVFDTAGLFERHEITEQVVKYKDEEGKEKEKTIKVLTIVNSGYDDYMSFLKSNGNFSYINVYTYAKNSKANQGSWFTDNQIETIESLYSSEYFFQEFSSEFQEHSISKGSNTTEKDFSHPAYNNQNIFTNSGFKGQCTWYVYGRALKLTGKKMPSGDAQTWLTSARAMGYPTGIRPSKNAVVVLSGGQFGHVAFVESWDGKTMTVSEGNYNNPCAQGTCNMVDYANKYPVELVHEQTYSSFEEYKSINLKNSGLTVVGFIYLD